MSQRSPEEEEAYQQGRVFFEKYIDSMLRINEEIFAAQQREVDEQFKDCVIQNKEEPNYDTIG